MLWRTKKAKKNRINPNFTKVPAWGSCCAPGISWRKFLQRDACWHQRVFRWHREAQLTGLSFRACPCLCVRVCALATYGQHKYDTLQSRLTSLWSKFGKINNWGCRREEEDELRGECEAVYHWWRCVDKKKKTSKEVLRTKGLMLHSMKVWIGSWNFTTSKYHLYMKKAKWFGVK